MRSLLLILCCCVPCCVVLMQFVKIYKSISMLKNFSQVFVAINFILSGIKPEVKDLFRIIYDREVFPDFTEDIYMKMQNGESFALAWKEAVQGIGADFLTQEEVEEIKSFSSSFGLGSLEEQRRICDHFSMLCNNIIDDKNRCIAKNGKMCLSGSLLLGALLFILLC